jgi:hypothetical protein
MTYKYLVLGAALAAQAGAQEIRCINSSMTLIDSPTETVLSFQPSPQNFPGYNWNSFGLLTLVDVVNGEVRIDRANIQISTSGIMVPNLGPYRARVRGPAQAIRRVTFKKYVELNTGYLACPEEVFNVADGVVVPNSVPVPTLSWGGIALMLLAFGATAWAARRG